MTTTEERKDMIANALPLEPVTVGVLIDYVSNCPADRVLTNITLIDAELDKIESALKPYVTQLGIQRNKLLERAKAESITEDSEAMLVEKRGKQFRNEIQDLEAFKLSFPEGYETIREQQEKDIEDAYKMANRELEESKIPLTLADKKIGKDAVTEFVGYKPVTITYEVLRK
jgi:hypothetical protein